MSRRAQPIDRWFGYRPCLALEERLSRLNGSTHDATISILGSTGVTERFITLGRRPRERSPAIATSESTLPLLPNRVFPPLQLILANCQCFVLSLRLVQLDLLQVVPG